MEVFDCMKVINMVLDIIGAVVAVAFLALGIVFQSIEGNVLAIIFTSLILVNIIGYFVIKAIYYGTNNTYLEGILKRIWEGLGIFFYSLILIDIILNLNINIKWWLFGIACLLGILLLIFNSIKILDKCRLIIWTIILCIYLGIGFIFLGNSILFYILCGFAIGYFIIFLIDNWILDVFELIPIILLGIFLIFI